jgi:hypothetical protein
MLAAVVAHADGGAVQLHAPSGPFLVTVFTEPASLRVGPIDTSVLVQERETGRIILDATVNLAFQPTVGASARLLRRAERGRAKNKLLSAAVFDLPTPGWWYVQVFVSRGREEAVVATNLLVMSAPPRVAVIWPLVILPPFAIGLFVLHQTLQRTRQR